MKQEFRFDEREAFLEKLRELVHSGVSTKRLQVITPFPVHEVEEILKPDKSAMRFFALLGALAGLITGFAFTIFTVKHWPLITGGKPVVSIPPFVIIAFALTILFGALVSFAGFLFLSRLPSVRHILEPVEYGNQFVILIDDGE